jgi:hypothetical protein
MRVGIDAHKMKCTTVMFEGDSVTGSFDFQTTRQGVYEFMKKVPQGSIAVIESSTTGKVLSRMLSGMKLRHQKGELSLLVDHIVGDYSFPPSPGHVLQGPSYRHIPLYSQIQLPCGISVRVKTSFSLAHDLARPATSPIARPLVAGIPNVPKICELET